MHNILKHTWQNLKRHAPLHLAAVIVIALLFLMFDLLMFSSALSDRLVVTLKSRLSFNVYVKEDSDFFTIRNLMETLEKRPDVTPPVVYTSPEESKARIKKTLQLDKTFFEKNPLSLPGSLTITPRFPSDEKNIREFLEGSPFQAALFRGIDEQVQLETQTIENVSQNLQRLQSMIRSLIGVLIGFMIFSGVLTVFITLKLSASIRKRELFIMKLIGASPAMLEIPFLLEGIIISLAGLFLGTAAFAAIPSVFFEDPFFMETYRSFSFSSLFVLEIIGGILLGFLGSALMVRKLLFSSRHLRFVHL